MRNTIVLLLATALLVLAQPLFAQPNADYSGLWKGAIEIPGMNLNLSVELRKEGAKWAGSLDIPVQRVKGMALGDLNVSGRDIAFKLPEVPGNASFSGSFDEAGLRMAGRFTQGGQSFPMQLARESVAQQAETDKRLTKAVATLRHLADSLRALRHTPGLGFGLVKDGKILMAEGFGFRNEAKKLPVTPGTLFAIGSSTKAFTTACLGILSDAGKLDWEKPVLQYLPDFQLYDDFATREMTATDLVCHRSGLPRHDLMWYGSPFSRKEIYERLRYLQPNKSLRSTWQYNNLMFMTAGYLVERRSGKTWEQFVKQQIFETIGMKSANCSVKELVAFPDIATGYRTDDHDQNIAMDYRSLDAIGPAGSINASVNDMLQWVALHLNEGKLGDKQILSKAEMDRAHRPQMLMPAERFEKNPELTDPAYGLGWFVYRHKGHRVVEHGGNIDGFTALVYLAPDDNFGLVLLANQNGAGLPAVLARYATDLLLNLDYTDWYKRAYPGEGKKEEKKDEEKKKAEPKRILNTQSSHVTPDYAGEYEHPGYGVLEVKTDGKKMRLVFNSFDLPLEHWHYDVFRARDTALDLSLMLNFATDADGVLYQVSTSLDPLTDDIVFKKRAPRRLSDPAFMGTLTGKYLLEDIGETTVSIELNNATLFAKVPGQPPYTLEPFQGTTYKLKGLNGYSLEFTQDDKGKVIGLAFNQPDGVYKARRL